jgi:uncharacterized protein
MFNNGFIQQNGSNMSNEEIAQKIRKDIIGELDAIIQYEQHAMSTNNMQMKGLWKDIANEEKVHIGELMEALNMFDRDNQKKFEEGVKEFKELMKR